MKRCDHLRKFTVIAQFTPPDAPVRNGRKTRSSVTVGDVCPDCELFFPDAAKVQQILEAKS